MAKTFPELETLARRAYERGRVGHALCHIALPVLMTLAAIGALGAAAPVAALVGAALALAYGYAQYRGVSLGRGARTGLLLGLLPFGVPWLVRTSEICWFGGSCEVTCMTICFVVGCGTGLGLALAALRDRAPHAYGLGGGIVLLLAAGLGCVAIGLGEFVGVAMGFALTAPVYAWRTSRA